MQYTEEDLKVGTKLRCTDAKGFSHWTTGKVYTVKEGNRHNYIEDDKGTPIPPKGMIHRLNKENKHNADFEIIEEEEQMKYTENDIKEGTKLICTKASVCWWTTAKVYEVSLGKDGILFIKDDQGHYAYLDYMLDCLNGNHVVEFEIVEYPTATITVDVEQRINDKIEALDKERMNIIGKIERMKAQQLKLRDKIQKLKEAKKALEILKEFK